MKINPVKTISFHNINKINYTSKSISFGEKEWIGDVADLKRQKDEDIKEFFGDIDAHKKIAEKTAKNMYRGAKVIFYLGKKENFANYKVKMETDDGSYKVVFGETDKNTGLPKTASLVDVSDKLKTVRKFEFGLYGNQPLDMFKVTDYNDEITSEYIISGKKLVSYSEQPKDENVETLLMPMSGGFHYIEAKTYDDGQDPDFTKEAIYREKPRKEAYATYIEYDYQDKKVIKTIYRYDPKSKMWKFSEKEEI